MVQLAQAQTILDKAFDHARTEGMPPMTMAVLDARGCVVSMRSEDGSGLMRGDIARAKAWGALGLGLGSRAYVARAESHPAFFTALTALATGGIAPVPGGVLVRDAGNAIIGAVGVSGDLPDKDEACALAGIEAAGLGADPGA